MSDQGIHDDEFPDEHDHKPEFELQDGGVRAGVYVTDDEGRHYWLSIKMSGEGIVTDVYDRYGDQLIATSISTFDDVAERVMDEDPLYGEH